MQDVPSDSGSPDEHGAATVDGARADASSTVLQRTDALASPLLWGQAFPVATWKKVLGARPVTLSLAGGPATLLGARHGHVRRYGLLAAGRHEIPLAEHDDDWLWVEDAAGTVTWTLPERVELPPVTVVIPTYRREEDALAQARRFLQMEVVTSVVVVDQGGTLPDHREFAHLLATHPSLQLVTQANLGGSGGYARGMLEASRDPAAAVLFSDDDAVLSEESLRRMVTYQALSAGPTIVGTPLFSAARPSLLVAHTEKVDSRAFQWRSSDRRRGATDLAGTGPADWTFLTAQGEANYTGWWGTLFPPGTALELGYPAPLFLKWDDAEYGLRATAHGYRHAVLPGTAVHHPPWTAYRTQMTWTARVLHRNRLAIAAAYGAGRGVVGSSLLHQAKHVLSGHLLTAELWEHGIDAVRGGPQGWLGDDLGRARAEGAQIVDRWHRENDIDSELAPTHPSPLPLPTALRHALGRMLRPDGPPRVVLDVPADLVHWRTTLGGDALRIIDDAGKVEVAFAMQGSTMRRALARSLRSHLDLAQRWPELQASYRRALPLHTTGSSWSALIAAGDPHAGEDSATTDDSPGRT